MRKLKHAEISIVREQIRKAQGNKCVLCGGSFSDAKLVKKKLVPKLVATLDHNHINGAIRGVLCNNCNGIEGKIHNRVNRAKRDITITEWLENLVAYWKKHEKAATPYIHPTHKTKDEKRLAINAKARRTRAAAAALKILRKPK